MRVFFGAVPHRTNGLLIQNVLRVGAAPCAPKYASDPRTGARKSQRFQGRTDTFLAVLEPARWFESAQRQVQLS